MENKPPPSPRNNNTIVATEICEPVTAVEIYPVHSLYTIASDYVDIDIDIENNAITQEPIIYDIQKQDCCPSLFINQQLPEKYYMCSLIFVICFGIILTIWFLPR